MSIMLEEKMVIHGMITNTDGETYLIDIPSPFWIERWGRHEEFCFSYRLTLLDEPAIVIFDTLNREFIETEGCRSLNDWSDGEVVATYTYDELIEQGGCIKEVKPECKDNSYFNEDTDFVKTDKTLKDIFPDLEYKKLYFIKPCKYYTRERETHQDGEKPLSNDRISHMVGVAEYMYRNADRYDQDKYKMYLLGLIHDIGYLVGSTCHELIGADIVGKYSELGHYIAHHGISPKTYMQRYGRPPEAPLVLLWEADMMIGPKGDEVGLDYRLMDILDRYGSDSDQYINAEETIEWLKASV